MDMKAKKKLFSGKESFGEELKEAKAIKAGKISPKEYAQMESKEPAPKMKKMAGGGQVMRGTGCATKGTKYSGPY